MAEWDDAPVVGKALSLAPPSSAPIEPGANPWDAAPIMSGPSAQSKAVVTANDDADSAGRAFKIGKKLGVSPQLVQGDVDGWQKTDRNLAAQNAAKIPPLAKYINDNPGASSVSSDDWPAMTAGSASFESLNRAAINGVAALKAANAWLKSSSIQESFERGFGPAPIGLQDFQDEKALKLASEYPLATAVFAAGKTVPEFIFRTMGGIDEVAREHGLPPPFELGFHVAASMGFPVKGPAPREVLRSSIRAEAKRQGLADPWAPPPEGNYVSVDQFLSRAQAWADRAAIDEFLKSKEQQSGPILMIAKADHAKEVLNKAVEIAQDSKTKERSPDLYAAMGAAHGDDILHIPADKILDLYRSAGKTPAEGDGLFGFVPDLAKQLESAVQTGSEISIPASQYIAHIDPAVHAKLADDVRLHDDGVTVTEAKEAKEEFQAAKSEEQAAVPEKLTTAAIQLEDGTVVTGQIHADAFNEAGQPRNAVEGFVTDQGRFVDRVEAAQIASKAEQSKFPRLAEGDKVGVEDLKDNYANIAPQAETTKGKPGANTSRLANLLSQQLYGEQSNMTTVSVKEMMQNGFDAIKGMIEKGTLKGGGKISIDLDRYNRTITVFDNGSGMTPAVLGKQFLEIAGTSKETEAASGGLGIAKMQFLFGNKELHVITLRDGKVSEMVTTGDQLRRALSGDESAAPDINTRIMSRKDRELFPDGHGTIVKVTVPESYKDVSTGEEKKIAFTHYRWDHPVTRLSPLFGDIEVKMNGETLPIGKHFPLKDYTQFANVNFDWGTARIYVTKDPVGEGDNYQPNAHVLSNGLWQFSFDLKKDPQSSWGPNINHNFYIDASPNVSPDQPGYPFALNRQEFSVTARKDFQKIFQYIQRAYQQLDYANSAKNFGDIEYLSPDEAGIVAPSEKQKLQPEGAVQAVETEGMKAGDNVEVVNGKLIVNNREIPELSPEDLKGSVIDIDRLQIDQKLIDPNRVMLHDNIEIKPKLPTSKYGYEQVPFEEETPAEPRGDWVSLVDAARERFPERFDTFMFDVGEQFLQLRQEVANALGYPELLTEGIGISFDPEYRGVSIRLPFSASFVNPALTVFTDPVRAAVGIVGTMIHELAHHKVRSHNAEFPAEMQKIQIFLDTNEILNKTQGDVGGFTLSQMKQQMVKIYEANHDIFTWLRDQIVEGDSTTVRTRGKRFKEPGEVAGGDGGAADDLGSRGNDRLGPSYQSVKGGEGDAGTPSDPEGPTAIIGATKEAVAAEKRQLYLNPLFKDAKSVGITAGEFSRYSRKLEKAENDILDRAIRLHAGKIKKTLSAEWKRDEAALREASEAELRERGPFAAEKFIRENKIDLKAENADEFAVIFGYSSGGDLLANLASIKAQERAGVSIKKQFDQTVEASVKEQMQAKHGDLATKIADEAREIATDGHTFDVLDFELRTLANAGKLPLPVEKEALVANAKTSFENSLLTDGANYAKLRRAVEKAGRDAEKALLKGDLQEAFQAKQRQFMAAVHMRESNRLQRTIDSVEKKVDKFTSQEIVPSVDQTYTDQIRKMLESVGIPQQFSARGPMDSLANFVADSEGQLAVAPWLMEQKVPSFNEMTVAQFKEFQKSFRSLEHVGAKAKQLDSAHGKADLDNVVFDIIKEFDRFPLVHQPNIETPFQGTRRLFRQIIGAHLLVERMLDYTDQFNPNGPITAYLDRPLRDSNVKELELTERVSRELRALKPLTDTSINEIVENNLFRDERDRTGFLKMNRQNVRIVALNMGNRSNIAKVTEGFNVDEKDVRRWLDKNMRPQDWNWVQGMWDIFAWLKTEADAMQLRDTGVPADTLEPVEINGKTGGYAPIVYSRDGSNIAGHIAAKNPIFAPTYYTATTPQGYTIARTAFAAPLDLNGTYLPSKMQAMVHDIAFREAVRNASKLINHPEFSAAIAQKWSSEYKDLLHGWLKDIANSHLIDDAYAKDWARGIAMLRHNVTSTLIAMNPGTFIKHGFTAMGMSIERVGAGNLAGAAFEIGPGGFVKSGVDLIKRSDIVPDDAFIQAYRDVIEQGERGEDARNFILQSSAVMRNRQRTYVDSIRGSYEESTRAGLVKAFGDVRQFSMNIGRVPVAFSDALSAMPTWLAAYRTAFGKGASHEDAVFIADKEVSRAHGSSFIGDKPRVSRLPNSVGGEVLKTFVGLYNFWNHSFNNQIQMAWDLASKLRDEKQFEGQPSPPILDVLKKGEDGEWYYRPEPNAAWSSLSKRLALILATIMIEEMATAPLDDSKHGLLARASLAFIRYAGSGIVGLREVTTAFAHGYEPSTGMIGTMSRSATQVGKDIYKAGAGKTVSKDWMAHFATALGFMTGIGGSQYGRTATGVTGMVTGKDVPRGQAQIRQQLRTGHSKPRTH